MTNHLPATVEDRTIGAYLTALSSGEPTPGGGSAAGLAGALGCALGSMVCSLTLAREPNEQIDELRRTLLALRDSMLRQSEADERAFSAFRDATMLPRATTEEKAARRAAMEDALVGAAEVPEQLMILGLEALAALRETASGGSRHALGDLLTGGYLIRAMIEGSMENIDANIQLMKADDNRARFMRVTESGRTDLQAAMQLLEAEVASRFAQSGIPGCRR